MDKLSSSTNNLLVIVSVWILLISATIGYSGDDDNSGYFDDDGDLSFDHYLKTCPNVEAIINRKVSEWLAKDRTLGAGLLRLHFHDSVVRGCDGSVLLNHEGSERSAYGSKTLRGFEVIDDIKSEMEKHCPRTVSCADILTAASRDATVSLGGPYWRIPYGRKDGKVSIDKEADEVVPMGHENITTLMELFQSKGLNMVDLVVLSGAHTIGRSTCSAVQDRLYGPKGKGRLDDGYLNYLSRKCRWASEYVDLDAVTPNKFDNQYYTNVLGQMGLLSTDRALAYDPRTLPLVKALAFAPGLFPQQFAASMTKLGNILDPRSQDDGEIRLTCSSVNANPPAHPY